MLQLQGPKNNFWLLTADNAGALTVCYEPLMQALPPLKGHVESNSSFIENSLSMQ